MFFVYDLVIFLLFTLISKSYQSNVEQGKDVSYEPELPEDTLTPEYGRVVFSSMLFRHGARHRVFRYPADEHVDFYEEKGWGLLTKEGKTQVYNLGKWVGARYADLIKESPYHADVLHALSTLSDRTISSAQLFLSGFYPPTTEDEIWKPNLDWQPIPVYSTPKAMDKMLLLEKYCARYNYEMLRVNMSPDLQKYYQDYEVVFNRLKKDAGVKFEDDDIVTAINEAVHMRDNLIIDQRFGLKLPDWSRGIYPEIMAEMTLKFFEVQTYNHQMKRLKGGLLVKNIVDDMKVRRDALRKEVKSKKRFQIYSGHDTTIAVLLNTLGIFDNQHPLYGALVLVELREKKTENEHTEYYVTILYRNGLNEPKLLELKDCKNPCPLNGFIEATKDLIPEDWERECEYLTPDYNTILF